MGAFGMVDFFDDRPKSGTFGARVARCPGFDLWLYYGFGVEPSDVAESR